MDIKKSNGPSEIFRWGHFGEALMRLNRIRNYSAGWVRNPHIKGRIHPSMGLDVASPGDKYPCDEGCEPISKDAE